MDIKRVNKNYYRVGNSSLCSVLVDDVVMRKAIALEEEFRVAFCKLLHANEDRCIKENWGLAYPFGHQTTFYSSTFEGWQGSVSDVIDRGRKSQVTKIENLFELPKGASVHDESAKAAVGKFLEEERRDES